MHILVTNDDGPPSNQSSPYVHPFVHYLQQAGHLVSVILPHQQRSWIGKAHFVGQITKPTYFRPGTLHLDDGTTHPLPSPSEDPEEWILVDGTPATCAQLGLHHFFQSRPPISLVVSGPNYGRNSTSLFSLSSGTVGGAMEAAVCQKRAVALSFAFWSRDHKPDWIAGACKHSVRLIEHLAANWDHGVDLYSINVPVAPEIGTRKVMYTHALQNYWTSGSSFEEIAAEDEIDPQGQEKKIRESGESSESKDGDDEVSKASHGPLEKHKWFKWAPKFGDVQKSIDASPPGNDGWALHQGYTSVTPLKANYMHATDVPLGELKLPAPTPPSIPTTTTTITTHPPPIIYTILDADAYTLPLIHAALATSPLSPTLHRIPSPLHLPHPTAPLLQILPYESLHFPHHIAHPTTSLANSYVIRKALTRKHYLWHTISTWWSKHPDDTTLKGHVPPTVVFELDYAEFLPDALVECFELHASFARPQQRAWWILKPAMSDQAQGIRLFSSMEELQAIFDAWEEPDDDDDDDDADDDGTAPPPGSAAIPVSQLRHFIAQPYIHPPLLFSAPGPGPAALPFANRKFHLRVYVLAVGALRVYVHRDVLALFAPAEYAAPPGVVVEAGMMGEGWERVHLTNTCLHAGDHAGEGGGGLVYSFWDLPSSLPSSSRTREEDNADWKPSAFRQIRRGTATLFRAAALDHPVHFQPLPNSFEVFGVDWVVDRGGTCWLLEVNAFPDFRRTGGGEGEGEGMKRVVRGVWEGVVRYGVEEFFGGRDGAGAGGGDGEGEEGNGEGMVKVLDLDMGRR